jgi:hypothetical protein
VATDRRNETQTIIVIIIIVDKTGLLYNNKKKKLLLPPSLPKKLLAMAQVIVLPNMGRCDHSYAYWIAHARKHMNSKTKETQLSFSSSLSFHANDIIWFVKDNDNAYRTQKMEIAVPLSEMLHETSTTKGYSSASKLSPRFKKVLGHFDFLPLNIAVQQQMGRFQIYSVYHRTSYNVSVDVAKGESSSTTTEQRDIFFPTNPNITELADWVDSLPIYNFSLGNNNNNNIHEKYGMPTSNEPQILSRLQLFNFSKCH